MEGKENPYLTVGMLKKQIEHLADDIEVYIRCCYNPCGNMVNAGLASETTYGFFGTDIPCVIIEPSEEN